MAFYTSEKPFKSSFVLGSQPRLLSVCQAQGNFSQMPRVMHQHDDRIEILLVCSGEGHYIIDGTNYRATAGDIVIYNRGAIHDESASPEADMVVYSLAVTDLKLQDRELNQFVPQYFHAVFPSGASFESLHQLFEQIYQETVANDVRHTEIANYLLWAMIVMIDNLIQKASRQLVTDEKALGQEIKDYLDAHYLEDLTLGQIADTLHINQFYLSHIFKAFTEYSPMQYVIRRRIGEAQSLLLNTSFSVTQIATRVGYNNINHFHSIFFKIVGLAPGKYRTTWKRQQ